MPTDLTEFAVLYDDEYICVAINSHDSYPSGIRSILSHRDGYGVNADSDSNGQQR